MEPFYYYLIAGIVYAVTAVITFIGLTRKLSPEDRIPLSFLFVSLFWMPVYLFYWFMRLVRPNYIKM